MLATPGIRALIRDGKSHQLYSQIQTGGRLGMTTMAQSLAEKVREGEIDLIDAEMALSDTSELMNLIKAA
jgi:twitching motility protein PilT